MSADHRDLLWDVAVDERDLCDCTCGLPVLAANEANALAEELAHEVAGVVVEAFEMLVRIVIHGLDMFGLSEDAEEGLRDEAITVLRVPGIARTNSHLALHSRPNTVHVPMLATPDLTVLDAFEELVDIALAVGPRIGTCWQRAGAGLVFDGVSPAEIDLAKRLYDGDFAKEAYRQVWRRGWARLT